MAGELDICNAALLSLGQSSITSLTDGSNPALLCNQFYTQCRDELLRSHPWNFACKRVTLTEPLTTGPDWGFDYAYQLPTTPLCLRVMQASSRFTKFKVEGSQLFTDDKPVSIRYVAQITDPTYFDPLFRETLEAKISAKLAYPITKNTALIATMETLYKQKLSYAKGINGQEGVPDEITSDGLIDVRNEGVLGSDGEIL
jgi:hypothetical protein